jgi:phosphate transport system substrate-binding protein
MTDAADRRIFNVLFLCTGNSARSIMAEAILNREGRRHFRAFSAGSHPKGSVHPYALALLRDLNYDVGRFRSKSWSEFARPDAPKLDGSTAMMTGSGSANSARGGRLAATAVIGLVLAVWPQGAKSQEAVALRGAGSTFAAPLYKKWIDEYTVSRRNVSISYDAVGSGEGVKRFLAEAVDFAGSDEILSDSEISKGPGAIMVPVTAGMIVLAYNVPGVSSEIKFPRDVYLDIFAGKIRKWDDPRIQAANPRLMFPRRDIAIVARLDSSGTTAAFTNHLAAIGPSWRAAGMGVGKLIEWPTGVQLASGNEGVAARIRLSEGSIGYVEYWFAQRLGLRMAALQNKSGAFITPTTRSGELALSGRVAQAKELAASVADPAGPGAYPITTYSWMFLYRQYRDRAKGAAVREFALWGLSQPGQNYGAQVGYLPLSDDVISIGKEAIGPLLQ